MYRAMQNPSYWPEDPSWPDPIGNDPYDISLA